MLDNIPLTWLQKYLSDSSVAQVIMGQSPDSSTYNEEREGFPFYQGKTDFGKISPTPRIWCSKPVKIAEANDVLLSVRAPVGAVNMCTEKSCIGRGLCAIRAKEIVLPKFLYYFFVFYEPILKTQGSGAVFDAITKAYVDKIKVPIPPTLAEQQEIVHVLDTMSDIIRLREECISQAQDLIPALFQEMFGDIHNNKTNSQIVKLGDVADFIRGPFGGSLKKEIFVNEGYLVYEQYHAINNDFNFARYFIDEQKYKEMQRFSVKAGDLLISCSGTMGKIAIVPDNYKKGIINQALLKLTVNTEYLNNIFLKNLLLTDYYQKNYFKDQPGAAIQNVRSVKVLKNIDIILPSLSLQKQFVQKAIEIESYIEEQQEELENAKQMFQSLLHHAFTGELTCKKYGGSNGTE